jgi:hypothetical protein
MGKPAQAETDEQPAGHAANLQRFLLRYPPMSEKLSQGQEKFGADERKWRDVGAG